MSPPQQTGARRPSVRSHRPPRFLATHALPTARRPCREPARDQGAPGKLRCDVSAHPTGDETRVASSSPRAKGPRPHAPLGRAVHQGLLDQPSADPRRPAPLAAPARRPRSRWLTPPVGAGAVPPAPTSGRNPAATECRGSAQATVRSPPIELDQRKSVFEIGEAPLRWYIGPAEPLTSPFGHWVQRRVL